VAGNGQVPENMSNQSEEKTLIDWTGERYVPWMNVASPEIHYEHLHRYYFASQFISGKRVLDLASGEGYGCAIMAKRAAYVAGVEISEQAVRHANGRYPLPNVRFIHGSITKVPIRGESIFDVITCFEAIEHIDEQEKLLKEVKRLLKDDGLFIVSSPNKMLYSDATGYKNPYHAKELYFDEFKELLAKYFPNITFFGQKVFPVSSIWPLGKVEGSLSEICVSKTDIGFNLVGVEDKIPLYFIAISSEKNLPETSFSLLTDVSEKQIGMMRQHIANLENIALEKEAQIANLENALQEKEAYAAYLESAIRGKEEILNNIYNSRGWKVLLTFYRFKNKIFSTIAEEKKLLNFIFNSFYRFNWRYLKLLKKEGIKKSIFYIRSYGLFAFLQILRKKLISEKKGISNKIPNVPNLALPMIIEDEIFPEEDATVSIVIPAKNASTDFELLLPMYKEQKGLKDLEIIVVDSGSSDNTIEMAKTYGAKIIEITPEKFSHSYSRNLGAENASGRYLFFTVQDALPPSKLFLHELISVLKNNDLAAVSCAEFPREDSDLFYRILIWNHYKFLEVDKYDRILTCPEKQNYIDLRKNGQLSDLACLIPKDTFMNYKYRLELDYAEDIDLGIRLIKDGHKLAFLSSIKIIHSHNRPSYYFLKRAYVDCMFLSRIFPDYPLPVIQEQLLFRDILLTYRLIDSLIKEELDNLMTPFEAEELFKIINNSLSTVDHFWPTPSFDHSDCPYMDEDFKSFLKEVSDICRTPKGPTSYDGTLIRAILNFINNPAKEYMLSSYQIIDDYVLEDIKSLLIKAYAMQCGAHLAYCYLNDGNVVKDLHNRLTEGI
jgi:glycosyltransferase involved in cell wall biosynthesis/SAM-dependent methyltransferase